MAYENNDKKIESIYSKRIRAGKRRTYFFDVRATRGNDYYLTITESRKRFDDNGYDRHKVFLYKEDFNKFIKALNEAVDYVKTDLMPDFDFDAFNHEDSDQDDVMDGAQHTNGYSREPAVAETLEMDEVKAAMTPLSAEPVAAEEATIAAVAEEAPVARVNNEEVDKW